jgi:hypothetical protein
MKPAILQFRLEVVQQATLHPGMMPNDQQLAIFNTSVEIKRPGETKWVVGTSPNVGSIRAVKCPGGSPDQPQEIYP